MNDRTKNTCKKKELHLTQVDVKKQTGISNGNLSEIENGNTLPSAGALMALSQALDVTTDWILFGENSKSNNSSSKKISDFEYSYIELFRKLDTDDQDEILAMITLKLNRRTRGAKSTFSEQNKAIETA
ncbi:helix-turn-helix domain-containing protein [Parablautia sp. Marseille-Q6255]|uniref:helix-turn-helix domain-containing protein n=1 Tax=Parablautia sp. Marseille-Q6255 TaxID=3039593 RepID=UPI0024BC5960|nr:helix-turn-helix domain-containing protein [Parablautia sp. Marseille-Q6255]